MRCLVIPVSCRPGLRTKNVAHQSPRRKSSTTMFFDSTSAWIAMQQGLIVGVGNRACLALGLPSEISWAVSSVIGTHAPRRCYTHPPQRHYTVRTPAPVNAERSSPKENAPDRPQTARGAR